MSYEIIITEKREVVRKIGKDWAVVSTKERDRDDVPSYAKVEESKTWAEIVYGYTPEIEKTVLESREVLKQTVDTLDLPAVIKAINKL